jgi:hypothetical protein
MDKTIKNHWKNMFHNSCHFSTNKLLLQILCCCHIFIYLYIMQYIFWGGCWNIGSRIVNTYRRLRATYSIIRILSPIELTGAIISFEVYVNSYHNMRLHTTQHLAPSEPRINFAGTKKSLQIKLYSETKCTLINLIIMSTPSYHFSLLQIKYVFWFKLCCNSGTRS